jgi:Flp pilus assembly protein TadB
MTAAAVIAALLTAVAVQVAHRPRPSVGAVGAPAERPPPRPPTRGDGWLRPAAAVGGAVAVLVVVGGTPGLLLGAVAAVAAWVAVGRVETPGARRRRERIEAALPTVVDLMAACLAGGQAPGSALAHVAEALPGPVADELSVVAARVRLGVDPVTVWHELGRHPQLGALGRTVARALDGGASVADGMSRLAEDLRRDARARTESKARAVGVKAALPLGICLLPAFVLVGVVPLVVASLGSLVSP